MKKGFLFTGLFIAIILLGCYVLFADNVKEDVDSTLIRLGLRSLQPIGEPVVQTDAAQSPKKVEETATVDEESVKKPTTADQWPSTSAFSTTGGVPSQPDRFVVDDNEPLPISLTGGTQKTDAADEQAKEEAIAEKMAANDEMAQKQRIETLVDRIQELKENGMPHDALWNELNTLIGAAEPHSGGGHLDATGDDCSDPIVISIPAALPYADVAQTTCGRLNDYNATCLGNYDGGEDIIYLLTVTADTCIDIDLDVKGTTWTGICIDTTCPPDTGCIVSSTTYTGNHQFTGLSLAAGTYYIMIDTYPIPDCIPDFDLTITGCGYSTPGDNCTNPIAVTLPAALPYADANTTCGRSDDYFSTCLDYYDGGEDILYELTVTEDICVDVSLDPNTSTYTGILIDSTCPPDPTTCMQTSTNSSAGPHGLAGVVLTTGTYYIMVDTWPLPDCISDFDLTIDTCAGPPANDLCGDAIELIVGDPRICGNNTGATGPDCGDYTDPEIWYSFTLTDSCSDIAIEWCGTTLSGSTVGVLYDTCDCASPRFANSYEYDSCLDGMISFHWDNLFAGTYYYPFNTDGVGDYCLRVDRQDCPPPCVLECPSGAFLEGEPDCADEYDDMYNGGCNSTPYVYQPIACGDTVCGKSGTFLFATENYRDTDWYEISFAADTFVTWCGVAEFDFDLWIVQAGTAPDSCDDEVDLVSNSGNKCDTICISALVNPGTYWLVIAPQVYSGIPCGDLSEYVAWLACESPPPPPPNDSCSGATVIAALPYTDSGTTQFATDQCGNTSPDVFYKYTVPQPGESLQISLCNYDGFDTYLRVWDDCCVTELTSDDDGCPGYEDNLSEIIECFAPGGDIWIQVEGYQDYSGNFQLDVTSLGTCQLPFCPVDYQISIDCNGYNFTAPSLEGAGDDCDNGTGEDHMYEIEVLQDGDYTFSLCNSTVSFDAKMYLNSLCCGGSQLGYDDDGCEAPVGLMPVFNCISLTAGDTVYLDVEEYSSYTTGDIYTLDISCCTSCTTWVNCCIPEETEPNNTCLTNVDPHTIACDDTVCGKICPDTEHDVYPIAVPANIMMIVTIFDGELCDQSPTAYVRNDLLNDTCGVEGSGNSSGWILTNNDTTVWNLYLDVYQSYVGQATYKIATECCNLTDYCATPIVIPTGVYNYANWENSCCATDTVPCVPRDSCGSATCYTSGNDIIYEFTTTEVRDWTITSSGDGDNQVLVTTVCGDTSTCVGAADNTMGGEDEVISLTNLAVGTYYISTSLYSTNCGVCTLNVFSPEPPSPVTDLTVLISATDSTDVVLRWTTTGAPEYNIYSDTSVDGTFSTLEATVAAPPWTDDDAVTPGVRKYYRVYSSTP